MLPIEKINFDASHPDAPEILRPAVDLAVLGSYESVQVDGEPDLIVELIDLYLEDAPRRVAVMRESIATENWLALKREAHSLRGSSGNLGAPQVARICDEIEEIASAEPFPRVEVLLGCLEQELERVHSIFLSVRQRRLQ